MTRLLLINDTYPGGIVVRCDRCVHWQDETTNEETVGLCESPRETEPRYTLSDFGCSLFAPKESHDPE